MNRTRKAKQRGLDSFDYYRKGRTKKGSSVKTKDSTGEAVEAGEEDPDKVNKNCVICIEEVEVQGCLSGCDHWFCFLCIYEWSKRTNTCPLCKVRFRCITKKSADGTPDKTFRIKDKEQSFVNSTADDYDIAMGLLSESETSDEDVEDSDYAEADYEQWQSEEDEEDEEEQDLDVLLDVVIEDIARKHTLTLPPRRVPQRRSRANENTEEVTATSTASSSTATHRKHEGSFLATDFSSDADSEYRFTSSGSESSILEPARKRTRGQDTIVQPAIRRSSRSTAGRQSRRSSRTTAGNGESTRHSRPQRTTAGNGASTSHSRPQRTTERSRGRSSGRSSAAAFQQPLETADGWIDMSFKNDRRTNSRREQTMSESSESSVPLRVENSRRNSQHVTSTSATRQHLQRRVNTKSPEKERKGRSNSRHKRLWSESSESTTSRRSHNTRNSQLVSGASTSRQNQQRKANEKSPEKFAERNGRRNSLRQRLRSESSESTASRRSNNTRRQNVQRKVNEKSPEKCEERKGRRKSRQQRLRSESSESTTSRRSDNTRNSELLPNASTSRQNLQRKANEKLPEKCAESDCLNNSRRRRIPSESSESATSEKSGNKTRSSQQRHGTSTSKKLPLRKLRITLPEESTEGTAYLSDEVDFNVRPIRSAKVDGLKKLKNLSRVDDAGSSTNTWVMSTSLPRSAKTKAMEQLENMDGNPSRLSDIGRHIDRLTYSDSDEKPLRKSRSKKSPLLFASAPLTSPRPSSSRRLDVSSSDECLTKARGNDASASANTRNRENSTPMRRKSFSKKKRSVIKPVVSSEEDSDCDLMTISRSLRKKGTPNEAIREPKNLSKQGSKVARAVQTSSDDDLPLARTSFSEGKAETSDAYDARHLPTLSEHSKTNFEAHNSNILLKSDDEKENLFVNAFDEITSTGTVSPCGLMQPRTTSSSSRRLTQKESVDSCKAGLRKVASKKFKFSSSAPRFSNFKNSSVR